MRRIARVEKEEGTERGGFPLLQRQAKKINDKDEEAEICESEKKRRKIMGLNQDVLGNADDPASWRRR